ncbi:LXG domain-containing protein [Sutcliffiella horikoshii]|uniref:ribonuclease YeeF family protein n=1 Tax=Sutcliffiella horikoshii TaxID=79883 RepID=UPI00384B79AD
MKVIDLSSLHDGIKGMSRQLSDLENQLNHVESGIRTFVSSKDSFRGKGASAIKRFYEYAHLPFLQFFQTFLANFQSKLQQLQYELDGLEGNSRGFIDEGFLTGELEDGLNQINRMVTELTGETNYQLSRVSDIVHLPRLQDHQFHEGIQQAKQSANQTVDKLRQFDHHQTQSFTALMEDLSLIQSYIEEMSQQFVSGKIKLASFSPVMLQDLETYGKLQTKLYNQTVMQRWNSEHYPELGVFYTVGNPLAFNQWVNPSCARPEPKIRSLDDAVLDFRSGFADGAKKFLKETKDGIVRLVSEPHLVALETLEFAYEAAKNPEILWEIVYGLADSFSTMVLNGDAQSRGEWFGYAVPTVGSIFAGGTGIVKGAGKAVQTGRKTQMDLEIKLKDKQETPKPIAKEPTKPSMDRVRELMDNLVPRRGMEPALVMVDNVPFNVLNSTNIIAKVKQLQTLVLMRIEAVGFGRGVNGTGKGVPEINAKYATAIDNKVTVKEQVVLPSWLKKTLQMVIIELLSLMKALWYTVHSVVRQV